MHLIKIFLGYPLDFRRFVMFSASLEKCMGLLQLRNALIYSPYGMLLRTCLGWHDL